MLISYLSKLKGYRTLLVNVAMAIMPILEMSEILDVLPQEYEAPYALFIAVANLYLRSITNTPMGQTSVQNIGNKA